MTINLKCIHCIEKYIQLKEEEKTPEAWDIVQDAVTLVPSWQLQSFAPGQMVAACVTVPVCLDHIKMNKEGPEQIAARNGLFVPGQN